MLQVSLYFYLFYIICFLQLHTYSNHYILCFGLNIFLRIFAPCINLSMSIPATAIGNNPTGVNTEYLPPILSGITNVVYFSSFASVFNAPF